MAVEHIEIQRREPFHEGASFQGHVYERIDVPAHYAVDPLEWGTYGLMIYCSIPNGSRVVIRLLCNFATVGSVGPSFAKVIKASVCPITSHYWFLGISSTSKCCRL